MDAHRGIRPDRRGFTILELLIVIVMISTLAAISLGKGTRIRDGWRVTRATQAMSEELQQGFAIVGRNRRPIIFHYDSVKLVLSMRGRNDTTYKIRNFGLGSAYGLDSSQVHFTKTRLEVYPPGLAADSLSIIIKARGTARRIRMLRGGLVQICPTGDPTKC